MLLSLFHAASAVGQIMSQQRAWVTPLAVLFVIFTPGPGQNGSLSLRPCGQQPTQSLPTEADAKKNPLVPSLQLSWCWSNHYSLVLGHFPLFTFVP